MLTKLEDGDPQVSCKVSETNLEHLFPTPATKRYRKPNKRLSTTKLHRKNNKPTESCETSKNAKDVASGRWKERRKKERTKSNDDFLLLYTKTSAEEHRPDAATRPQRNWKGNGTLDTFSRLRISHRVANLGKAPDDLGFLFFNFVRYVDWRSIIHKST